MSEALADREKGLVFEVGNVAVGEYLDRWLNDSVKGLVKRRSFESYAHLVRKHVTHALGRVRP